MYSECADDDDDDACDTTVRRRRLPSHWWPLLRSPKKSIVLLSVDAENDDDDDDDDEQESRDGHDAQWPRVPPSSPPPTRTRTTTTVPSRCTLLASWSRVEVLSLKSFDVLMEPKKGIYLFSLSEECFQILIPKSIIGLFKDSKSVFFQKKKRWVLWKRLLYTKARFFSFSIKRATTKKKVVSATGSGSVYIVVFKRRFLDVLTLLVEKARRSFF